MPLVPLDRAPGDAVCAICAGESNHRVHRAREMMFGLREWFRYLECGTCGCLQLLDVPVDLAEYYPTNYYSFAGPEPVRDSRLVEEIKRARAEVALRLPVDLIEKLVRRRRLPPLFRWTAGLGLWTRSKIADVGSGAGGNLMNMSRQGFSHLDGYDPYLDATRVLDGRVSLHRAAVEDMPTGYELIMLHHAFEHMPEPRATLEALAAQLAPHGALLIRTPVADSWAWRHTA